MRTLTILFCLATSCSCVAQVASSEFSKTVTIGGPNQVTIMATVPASVPYQLGFKTNDPVSGITVVAVATDTITTPATTNTPATTKTYTYYFGSQSIVVVPGVTLTVQIAPAVCDSAMVCQNSTQVSTVVLAMQIVAASPDDLQKVTPPVIMEEDKESGITSGTTRRFPSRPRIGLPIVGGPRR